VFDYDSVDLTDRTLIQERAIHIHALLKTSREGVAEIGECLVEVKSRLEHGKWLPWLKHEFGTNGSAERFMIGTPRVQTRQIVEFEY